MNATSQTSDAQGVAPSSRPLTEMTSKKEISQLVEDAVNATIGELVHKAVAVEEERRFRQLKWIVLVISLIGLGTFGTLATFVIEKVVDAKAGGIKETLELTRINGLAIKLDIAKGFSPEERDEAMSLLLRISKNPDLRSQAEVKSAIASVLESFSSAGLSAQVESLHDAFSDIVQLSGISTEILIHHYGRSLAARTTKPTGTDVALGRFEQLERIASGHNLTELPLVYRLLYEFKQGATESRVKQLLLVASDLEDTDRIRLFEELLIRTSAKNWQNRPDLMGMELQRTTRAFFKGQSASLGELFRVPVPLLLKIADQGVDRDESEAVAKLFARSS